MIRPLFQTSILAATLIVAGVVASPSEAQAGYGYGYGYRGVVGPRIAYRPPVYVARPVVRYAAPYRYAVPRVGYGYRGYSPYYAPRYGTGYRGLNYGGYGGFGIGVSPRGFFPY